MSVDELNPVSARELTKVYGDRTVVDRLSFDLPAGAITGFVGPNGSGKTTTIRMLLGLIEVSAGDASVLGSSVSAPSSYLPHVGALIDGPAFDPGLSGRANLDVLRRLGGIDRDRVDVVLEQVGLGDRADDRASHYSLGMRQRLGIAAALLPDPKLLILDEPTNGLDPAGIREIRALLRGRADAGTSIFVSSHLLAEVQMIADHLVMIREGRLVYEGSVEALLEQHANDLLVRSQRPEDLDELGQIAQLLGIEMLGRENGGIRIRVEREEDVAILNRAAFGHEIVLVEISPRESSLEEAFFTLESQGVERR